MSIDSQVILKITITQGSEGGAANFPFVNFRCHSFKTSDLLLRVFLLKRKKTVTQGRIRTTKPDLRILISLPYTTRHSSAKFESMIDRRLKFMFFFSPEVKYEFLDYLAMFKVHCLTQK